MYTDKYNVLIVYISLLKTNAMNFRYNCKIKSDENNTVILFFLNGEINTYCLLPEYQMSLELFGLKLFSPMDNAYVYNKMKQYYALVFIKKKVANKN